MRRETVYLAGGCFWGVQRYVALIPGVLETETGYANGDRSAVTYEQVCTGATGHAETVRVAYDADELPLATLLSLFFDAIDPTSVDRQGGDVGRQYRSGVYYTDPAQLPEIRRALADLQAGLDRPVAVEALPLSGYCRAEDYHQEYLVKNPAGYCHIGLDKLLHLAARTKRL